MPRWPEAGGRTVQQVDVYVGRQGYPEESNRVCNGGKDWDHYTPMSGGWLAYCRMLEHAKFGIQAFYQVGAVNCLDLRAVLAPHLSSITIRVRLQVRFPLQHTHTTNFVVAKTNHYIAQYGAVNGKNEAELDTQAISDHVCHLS